VDPLARYIFPDSDEGISPNYALSSNDRIFASFAATTESPGLGAAEETRAVKFLSVIRDETLFGGIVDIESPRNLRVIPDG